MKWTVFLVGKMLIPYLEQLNAWLDTQPHLEPMEIRICGALLNRSERVRINLISHFSIHPSADLETEAAIECLHRE